MTKPVTFGEMIGSNLKPDSLIAIYLCVKISLKRGIGTYQSEDDNLNTKRMCCRTWTVFRAGGSRG